MSGVTREHRAEASRLLGFEPAPSGWHLNVLAHRWVEGEPVPEWWLAEREQGALLPPVAQAIADRDARIGELERLRIKCKCWRVDYSDGMCVDCWDPACKLCCGEGYLLPATDTKVQLARVVELLRESYDELMTDGGCTVTHKIEQFFQEPEDHA